MGDGAREGLKRDTFADVSIGNTEAMGGITDTDQCEHILTYSVLLEIKRALQLLHRPDRDAVSIDHSFQTRVPQ